MDHEVNGTAALMLLAALIDSMERASPGVVGWLDTYLVEATSRASFNGYEREAIKAAREMLAGLKEGLQS